MSRRVDGPRGVRPHHAIASGDLDWRTRAAAGTLSTSRGGSERLSIVETALTPKKRPRAARPARQGSV
jgi:hypothetical protein